MNKISEEGLALFACLAGLSDFRWFYKEKRLGQKLNCPTTKFVPIFTAPLSRETGVPGKLQVPPTNLECDFMRHLKKFSSSGIAVRSPEGAALAFLILIMVVTVGDRQLQAQTPQVLYSFGQKTNNADGYEPKGSVVLDSSGDIYGTTSLGGSTGTTCNKTGGNNGVVFKLNTSGQESVLCSFSGSVGEMPEGNLVRDSAGNLYGTTYYGGSPNYDYGTVYKLSTSNQLTTLHSFGGQPNGDGANPAAGLVMDSAGNLYGTAEYGGTGTNNYGIVFKVVPSTKAWTVLYSFTGYPNDGEYPEAGLVRDSAGNLYGTTYQGGEYNFGTVFKLSTSKVRTILHSFEGYAAGDGAYPTAGLLLVGSYLYGTTEQGGIDNQGTAFKLSTSGGDIASQYNFQGGTTAHNPWEV